jgi:hypothetical protein
LREIMTILVAFHQQSDRNFTPFYPQQVAHQCRTGEPPALCRMDSLNIVSCFRWLHE